MRWVVAFALGWSAWPATLAAAQAEDPAVAAEESAELRSLRMAELELFGVAAEGSDVIPPEGEARIHVGLPPVLTSASPRDAARPSLATDLSWLHGLMLPDLPVRWDERVVDFLEFFRDDPRGHSLMEAWLRRSGGQAGMIRGVLRQHGLPEDLLYVAMVESGFDATARSNAAAVGMWQFVAATGEQYGLSRTHWIDQRLDPESATAAAARYLGDLHRRFGSWELALAAYNMGYGALLRSIRKFNTNDFWELANVEAGLPFETTIYVAKVMACAVVGRNPGRFGFADMTLDRPIATTQIEVTGGAPIGAVARAAGLDPEAFLALNPSLRRNRIPPDEARYRVRIPAGQEEDFAARFARLSSSRPAFRPYAVRFGEQVEDIARRHGVSVRNLAEVNEFEDGTRLRVGMTILVPATPSLDRPPTRDTAAGGRSAEPPSPDGQVDDRPVVTVPDAEFRLADRRRVFYQVQSGDTLREIGRFFHATAEEISLWNQLDAAAALQSGMVVQLYVPAGVDLDHAVTLAEDDVRVLRAGSDEFFDYHEAQRGRERIRYRVREGDTLTAIGRRFDLTVGSVARINRFSTGTTLRAGQEITVYAPVPPGRSPRSETTEAAAPPPAEAQPAAATEPANGAPATTAPAGTNVALQPAATPAEG